MCRTGVLMDLRFIPDDMEFDDTPKDIASEVPVGYEPRQFIATALQQSAVKLSWYVVYSAKLGALHGQ